MKRLIGINSIPRWRVFQSILFSVCIGHLLGCEGKDRITDVDPIAEVVPVFLFSPAELFSEDIYTAYPDSVWPGSGSSQEWFKFILPDTLLNPIQSARKFSLFGTFRNEASFNSVTVFSDMALGDTFIWQFGINLLYPGIPLLFCPLPSGSELLEILFNDNELIGLADGVDPVMLSVSESAIPYHTIVIEKGTLSTVLSLANGNKSIIAVSPDSTIVQYDFTGHVVDQWPGFSTGWTYAAEYGDVIYTYSKTGSGPYGHYFPGRLERISQLDTSPSIIAENWDFSILGMTIVDSTLFGIDSDGERSLLLRFSLQTLLDGGGFLEAFQDSIELKYLASGPLGSTPDGRILAVSIDTVENYDGRRGIILMKTDGEALGQWVTPFGRVKAIAHDGEHLVLYPITIANEAMGPYLSQFESGFVSPHTVWLLPAILPN